MQKVQSAAKLPEEFICQPTSLSVIKLQGEDATKYLQGQVTIDVTQLESGQALLGCHCDFKGKTWNVFYAVGNATEIYLICHEQAVSASLSELKKYGVFSKVEISDDSEQWAFVVGRGLCIEQSVAELFSQAPTTHRAVERSDCGFAIYFDHATPRYLLMLPILQAEKLCTQHAAKMVVPEMWDLLEIQAGIADIRSATSNDFVPQMMNMQFLDAIDFQKGCYMGQEVVARTKYLGKNKRATFILVSEQYSDVQSGDIIELQLGENWRRGGTILRSANIAGQSWALAVLANDTEQGTILRNKTHPEQRFTVQALPYNIAQ